MFHSIFKTVMPRISGLKCDPLNQDSALKSNSGIESNHGKLDLACGYEQAQVSSHYIHMVQMPAEK